MWRHATAQAALEAGRLSVAGSLADLADAAYARAGADSDAREVRPLAHWTAT